MISLHSFCLSAFLLLSSLSQGNSTREDVHIKVYEDFESPSTCFRRFNGTHQFGCSTSRGGSYGVVHIVEKEDDVNWFINEAIAGPYMVGLKPEYFQSHIVTTLLKTKKVSGIFVIAKVEDRPSYFSPDNVCPNPYSSGASTCNSTFPWNPKGNSFLYEDWDIPIFIVNRLETINTITKCFQNFNLPLDNQLSRSLCSLHLNAHMYGAVDSRTCLRRTDLNQGFNQVKYCDPMGDQNIFYALGNFDNRKEKSVIVIATRLDTASLFDGIAPGAMSTVTGLATLLTITDMIRTSIPSMSSYDKSIVYLLLNGEGFDYIGSSKVVYDMQHKRFPRENMSLTLNEIMFFLDISQLDTTKDLYLYFAKKDSVIQQFSKSLKTVGKEVGLNVTESFSSRLPPTSFQTFYKAEPTLSGMTMGSFNEKFSNKYYHSVFDTFDTMDYLYMNGSDIGNDTLQANLEAIALAVTSSIAELVTGTPLRPTKSYKNFIDEILYCYFQNSACKLIEAISDRQSDQPNNPEIIRNSYPLYVGVVNSINPITKITGHLLEAFASPHLDYNKDNCSKEAAAINSNKSYTYHWIRDIDGQEVCVNTSWMYTQAISPAFEIEDYDWTSGQYPTWTESGWRDMSLRMYLRPSRTQEWVTLASGVVVILISPLLVLLITSKHALVFEPETNPVNC